MRVPVYEVPLSYYAKLTVDDSLPEDFLNFQKKWFIQRCVREITGVDTSFAPQPVLDRLLQERSAEGSGFREFVFSARNIIPDGKKINMALVPRGTDIPDQRLTTPYPRETFLMDVHIGGCPGETLRHEFRRTGIDLLTGDHIYREQPEQKANES